MKILSGEHRFAMQQLEIKEATIINLKGRCVKLKEESVVRESESDHLRKELDDLKSQNDVIQNQNETLIRLVRNLQQVSDAMKQFLKWLNVSASNRQRCFFGYEIHFLYVSIVIDRNKCINLTTFSWSNLVNPGSDFVECLRSLRSHSSASREVMLFESEQHQHQQNWHFKRQRLNKPVVFSEDGKPNNGLW